MNGENLINLLWFLLSQTCEISLSVLSGEPSHGRSLSQKYGLSGDQLLLVVDMVCKHPVMLSETIWITITHADFERVRSKLDYLTSMYPHHFSLDQL